MDIRQLQYLAALVREKHFTRAAEACNITQPTLSGRIRQLEQELGVAIVERGQRYMGLTGEGERVHKWALHILDAWTALGQEISQIKSTTHMLAGRISLGVIPSALPMAAQITGFVSRQFPDIDFSVTSLTSDQIIKSLEDFVIDVGLTYLDNEPVPGVVTVPLYKERYCLFVKYDDELAGLESIGWAQVARHPLCLLTPNMQNRRIVDGAFRAAGVMPTPRVETNSVVNLYANVLHTGLASVMPEYFFTALGPMTDIRAIPIIDPLVEHGVGAVALDRSPLPPLVAMFLEAVRKYENIAQGQPVMDLSSAPMP
jgi:DNA-binding transcriptional LysR family regulator